MEEKKAEELKNTMLTINGNVWAIKLVDDTAIKIAYTTGKIKKKEALYGLTVYGKSTIYLNSEYLQDIQMLKKILKHELTHAIIWEFSMDKEAFNEEEICDFMGSYADMVVNLANQWEMQEIDIV